ncbi:hypothetical protein JOQ06_004035 [Pogonophryne albipinna]|uniref:Uncharacterized protein n=1 Tax=Pogonophryne albipinna TaxID=1090488 RepID=A0AAD6F5H0_9TELE|nr:hypothetical protein JOQ06_004035 [Pogonophryne albipinna]
MSTLPRLLKRFHSKGGSMGYSPHGSKQSQHGHEQRSCNSVSDGVPPGVHRPTPKRDPEEDNGSQDLIAARMTIYRAKNNATEDIGIVVEGIKVLTALGTFPRACSLLIGLAYALNLAYPKEIRQTLEVFQKLFLELDCSKLSPKVNTLKNKLLA